MKPNEIENHKRISAIAGMSCSCLVIISTISIIVGRKFLNPTPHWLTYFGGICMMGAILAAIFCIIGAILGRKKPN